VVGELLLVVETLEALKNEDSAISPVWVELYGP
jgi:hypothetical protein